MRIAVTVVLCLLIAQAAQAQGQLQPHDGQAVFPGEGSVIILSEGQVFFNVDGPPGVYKAERPVDILVGAEAGNWVLSCHAEPLVGERGEICAGLPSSRPSPGGRGRVAGSLSLAPSYCVGLTEG